MNTDINENYDKRLEGSVFNPLNHTSKGYYAFIFVLLAIIAWGGFAYITQLRYGLIVTGLNDVTLWGVYIVNFIFFIGISYAGTLVSAVLAPPDNEDGGSNCSCRSYDWRPDAGH
jgi:hypothetical protein